MSKWAATLCSKRSDPTTKTSGPDCQERSRREYLWVVSVLILALLGTTCVINARSFAAMPPETGSVTPAPATTEELRRSWPSFRGSDGSGVSTHTNVPTKWDGASGKGILWKTTTPLPGANSPIVWKDRVFLSGATKDRREVYCFDAASGKILWRKEVTGNAPDAGQPIKVSRDTGFAAPTMATDGRRVYAMFAGGDVVAFDFLGNEAWSLSLGIPKNHYGHASSLATYKGRVIVQFDQGQGIAKDDRSKLLALDGATGRTVWQVTRQVPAGWCSPIVVEHKSRPQIITCSDPWVIAYSPQSGAEIWRANCLEPAEIGPSPIYSDGMVFAANDYASLSAIRAGGRGDVTGTHIAWSVDEGLPDICSPLATDRFILLLDTYGTLTCYDKKAGGYALWKEDFDAEFVSSPSLVGNRVYLFSRKGRASIVEPTRKACKRIAEADLGETCVTSPALQDGRIYIRGNKHLFCIGTK